MASSHLGAARRLVNGCVSLTHTGDLHRLYQWLRTQQPASYRVLGHLKGYLSGIVKNEVVVNRWPNPTVVILKPPPGQEDHESMSDRMVSLFSTDESSCKEVLMDCHAMDWTKYWTLGGFDTSLRPFLEDMARKHGGDPKPDAESCYMMHISPEDLNKFKCQLPAGYYPSHLTPGHASTVTALWPYHEQGTTEMMSRVLSQGLPAHCVRLAATGQLVGWTLTMADHSVAMGYVNPAHRRHGLGQYMAYRTALDLIKDGMPAYGHFLKTNTASIAMVSQMGWKIIPGMDVTWMAYSPPKVSQRASATG